MATAWYEGRYASTAAGAGLALWDSYVINNANWTCYDSAAGTNCKVYRCTDGVNIDFYVRVDDNYAAYASIQLWTGWNSGTHVGSGNSVTGRYWVRPAGWWGLSVRDTMVMLVDNAYNVMFVGAPTLFDTSQNFCAAYFPVSSGSPSYNVMAYTPSAIFFLIDENGSSGTTSYPSGPGSSSVWQGVCVKGIDNKFHVSGRTYLCGAGTSPRLLVGYISDFCSFGTNNVYFGYYPVNGDRVVIDGAYWMWCGGSSATKYWNLIKVSY